MEVDDRARLKMHHRLDELLGHEEADTLMAHLRSVTWQEVATKRDLDRVDVQLSGKIDAVDARLSGKMEALDHKIDALESNLRGEIHQAITHQTRWMAGFVAGFVSLWSGVVLGLARLLF